ncbi:MAG: signal peptidase [Blastococcus sp.]|nr:signal peptidase [Blastococcus sp.]
MGNAHQLTRSGQPERKTWGRTALYGAGTVSMLIISMASSLSLWIAFPWAFLGWTPTLVTSGSMEPLVAPGDVVMLRSVTPDELTPNTVVLYDRPETGRILHRILEQLPDGTFRTGGDANASPDSAFVHVEDIKGAAVLAVPWIGRPSLWLYQGRTLPLVAGGIALLIGLRLAPRAFDPAFDPWASGGRVNPAEVLLGRMGRPDDRRAALNQRLLPESLHDLVHGRLAAQSTAAQRRTVQLLEGLS